MVIFSPCLDCKQLIDKDENYSNFKCIFYPNGIPKEIFFDGSGMLCENENIRRKDFKFCRNEN